MYKIKTIIKVLFIILVIIVLNILSFKNSVIASNINTANVYEAGDCGSLLKYKGIVVKTTYIQYENNGNTYPAYCLNKTKPRSRRGKLYSFN